MLGILLKQPADQRDYDIDFSRWLPDGDTITNAQATAAPEGELTVESVQITDQIVKVWASGGNDGDTYTVTVTASTSGGRIKETDFKIRVRDC